LDFNSFCFFISHLDWPKANSPLVYSTTKNFFPRYLLSQFQTFSWLILIFKFPNQGVQSITAVGRSPNQFEMKLLPLFEMQFVFISKFCSGFLLQSQ
jgi:hypothetical protein